MTRWLTYFLLLAFSTSASAKEWTNLKAYKKETKNQVLKPSDWLKSDRKNNTIAWQKANVFNLKNNLPQEYSSIVQRRDFYEWLYQELHKKGHEVVWVKMAHFISMKMHLMEVFPYNLLCKKAIKESARQGSESVFNKAFVELQELYGSKEILKKKAADEWDKAMLKKEQFVWIEDIYKTMDAKSLKTLERIAKRKSVYGLVVPKAIIFKGDLSKPEARYNYAVQVLKPYCENRYKN